MKRASAFSLISIALAVLLAGCGESGSYESPAAPTALAISLGEASITLSWTCDDPLALNYHIYSTANGNDPDLDSAEFVNLTDKQYTFSGLDIDSTYTYRVVAYGRGGKSDPSEAIASLPGIGYAINATYDGYAEQAALALYYTGGAAQGAPKTAVTSSSGTCQFVSYHTKGQDHYVQLVKDIDGSGTITSGDIAWESTWGWGAGEFDGPKTWTVSFDDKASLTVP